MLIDFNTMEEKELEHFKGGEKSFHAKMFTDDSNKIMRGRLEPGASIGLHTHEGNNEIVFILEGTGKCCATAFTRSFPQVSAPTARRDIPTALSTTATATWYFTRSFRNIIRTETEYRRKLQ